MYLIQRTDQFDRWLKKLRDVRAKAKILARLKTVELGNLGDYKSVHSKLYEFRIDYGPGYRIYFTFIKRQLVVLLIGGTKSSQEQDIIKALSILKDLERDNEKKTGKI